MAVAVMRKIFKKLKPRTINYRSYKHFSNEAYRESQLHELSKSILIFYIDMRCIRENILEVIKCHL